MTKEMYIKFIRRKANRKKQNAAIYRKNKVSESLKMPST